MHPVIRILSSLAMLGYLSRADWRGMLLLAAFMLGAYLVSGVANLQRLGQMLRRLRYFFVAILVVYAFASPGTPLLDWPGLSGLTRDGLIAGLERVMGLVMIVAVVHWVLESTARDDLAAGLCWLLQPAAWVGVPVERFVLRLVLTLERIDAMLEHTRRTRDEGVGSGGRQTLLSTATRLFEEVITRAETERGVTVQLNMTSRPGLWQWLVWLLLVGALIVLSQLRNWV